MQLFYDPKLNADSKHVALIEEESRHLVKVLRKKEGDEMHLTNGKGWIFTGVLDSARDKRCTVTITDKKKVHRKMYNLHMAVAPTKNIARFEWFLEKATEIGVTTITPIICEYSERRKVNSERLRKIVLSAMKQSLRAYLPTLNDPIPFTEFINQEASGLLFIAHCREDDKMELKRRVAADKDIIILIGPEGDFSETEIALAENNGYLPVSLGEARLRTETAAIVACTTVAFINTR